LAQALDMSLVEFLASMLGTGDIDTIRCDANRRQTEEVLEKLDNMVERQRAHLDRPLVERLRRQVAFFGSYLTDEEVEYELEGWDNRLQRRWLSSTRETGLSGSGRHASTA